MRGKKYEENDEMETKNEKKKKIRSFGLFS